MNDVWVQILNNSTFILKIGNKSTCEYLEISYGNKNQKIDYNYFKKTVDNQKYKKQKYFNDFIKFSKFLEEFKSIFNEKFKKYPNFNLNIELKYETTFYNDTINIQCKYIYSIGEINNPLPIPDFNLLCRQNYNGFNTLIREIARFLDNSIQDNKEEDLLYQIQENKNEFYNYFNEYVDSIQYNI